jgi:uncharacterized protein involved in exopolysaccharide biosynthesis
VQLLAAGNRSSSILRDDLLLVQNNFDVIVQSAVVHDRTVRQLDLRSVDDAYTVTAAPILDSNYLNLSVRARTPELAQAIANTHASEAIQYYGELRAKPASTTADFLDGEIQKARATVTSLQTSTPRGSGSTSPELQQATTNYLNLLQKHSDALLASQDAERVSYIQVVQPAVISKTPTSVKAVGAAIGSTFIGSLGLGVLSVLLFESLFPEKAVGRPTLEISVNGRVEPTAIDPGVEIR